MVNVAREAMLAIGCIQAQKCHTDTCPTGVATQNAWLAHGLDPALKSVRAANYVTHAAPRPAQGGRGLRRRAPRPDRLRLGGGARPGGRRRRRCTRSTATSRAGGCPSAADRAEIIAHHDRRGAAGRHRPALAGRRRLTLHPRSSGQPDSAQDPRSRSSKDVVGSANGSTGAAGRAGRPPGRRARRRPGRSGRPARGRSRRRPPSPPTRRTPRSGRRPRAGRRTAGAARARGPASAGPCRRSPPMQHRLADQRVLVQDVEERLEQPAVGGREDRRDRDQRRRRRRPCRPPPAAACSRSR